MTQKRYTIDGKEYIQNVMSVNQIKEFLRLLRSIGVANLLDGVFNLNFVLDEITDHDRIENFLAVILLPKDNPVFDRQGYAENLDRFGTCDGLTLAEVFDDFLLFNEAWFKRFQNRLPQIMKDPEQTVPIDKV